MEEEKRPRPARLLARMQRKGGEEEALAGPIFAPGSPRRQRGPSTIRLSSFKVPSQEFAQTIPASLAGLERASPYVAVRTDSRSDFGFCIELGLR